MSTYSPGQDGGAHGVTPSDVDQSYQRYRQEDRSLGEIVSELMENASTLVKQEVELAKAEVKLSATRAGKGVGMFAGAAIAGLMALFALTLMLWWLIAILIGDSGDPALGWSGLIVTIIWCVVAGVLAVLGKGALDKVKGLPKTQETVKKIPNAVKGHEEENR